MGKEEPLGGMLIYPGSLFLILSVSLTVVLIKLKRRHSVYFHLLVAAINGFIGYLMLTYLVAPGFNL